MKDAVRKEKGRARLIFIVMCNCDIRKMGKARHELTYRHEENLKKNEVKEN